MGYNGRRMSGNRSRSRRSEAAILIQTLERVLMFPLLLLYLKDRSSQGGKGHQEAVFGGGYGST